MAYVVVEFQLYHYCRWGVLQAAGPSQPVSPTQLHLMAPVFTPADDQRPCLVYQLGSLVMSTALDDEGEVIHCFKYFHHLDKWMAVELDWVKLDNTQEVHDHGLE